MKAIKLSTLILASTLGALNAQTTSPFEFWGFNDAPGTDLKAAANIGSIGTTWDLATDIKGDITDGTALVLSGESGVYARRTDPAYGTPLPASGAYILEITLTGWTIDSSTLANNSYFRLVAGDSNMRFDLGEIQFRYQEIEVEGVVTPTVKLQYRVNTGEGFAAATIAEYTDMSFTDSVTWAVVMDYDKGTAQGYLNGIAVGDPNPFGPPDAIHGIVFGKAGTGGWGSTGTSVRIDSMGLSSFTADPVTTWNGYEVVEGVANTEDWLGWVSIADEPWLFSYSLGSWIYMSQQNAESGAWLYVLK